METQNNTFFYTNHHQPLSSAINFNPNIHNDHHEQQQQQNGINTDITNSQQFTKQHMFEKQLTPSDVGKLNRLVIPKQHAEKYFPLGGSASCADTVIEQQQKGLLLTFEDECGKLWRFRYSYWNSSQSYVLTKGWSRFVKDKHLDAGDVVLFERHMLDCEKMFVGWRRRSTAVAQPVGGGGAHVSEYNTRVLYDAQSNYPAHRLPISIPFPYQHDKFLHAGEVYENVDSYQRGVVATRRLRLFGVNLEFPNDSEPSTFDGSSHGGQSEHQYIYGSSHEGLSKDQYTYGSNNFHHNMMRYHQHEGWIRSLEFESQLFLIGWMAQNEADR